MPEEVNKEVIKKRWYVVQAYVGKENQVMAELQQRIKRASLEEKFGAIMVPSEDVVEMREGQKRKSTRKFFPGYVLVEVAMSEEIWHLIRDTPRVVGFIGAGRGQMPTPITQKEADEIMLRIVEGENKPRPKVLFEPGEVVRVTAGPFAEFNGVVEEVNYEKSRLKVAVLIFGRSTPVELEFGQVEKS